MIFNPLKKIKEERELFAKKYAIIASELQSEREFAKMMTNKHEGLKRQYQKRGKTIHELNGVICSLKSELKKYKDSDAVYFNKEGGILK